MSVADIGPVLRFVERLEFLDIRTARSKSGSSMILRFAAKAGEVTVTATIAMRNIRIILCKGKATGRLLIV